MHIRRFLAFTTLALGAVLFSCAHKSADTHSQKASDQAGQQVSRKPAPDFTLKDANGNDLKLSQLRGKVVLLNFWATWCGPCAMEIPWFVEFEQQYRSQGLEIVGVSMDEDGWKAVKPYVQEHKMNYRVLLGDESVGQLYGGVDSLPTSFLIDRDGKVAYVHVGLAGKNEYADEIQNLLGSRATGGAVAGLAVHAPVLLASTAARK